MNCPDCGRFMYVWPTVELEPEASVEDTAFHWLCGNPWDCLYAEGARGYVPAPEYDWLWWGVGDDELAELDAEDPETAGEFRRMKARCPARVDVERMRWVWACW